jgi:F0F1-type ATP synthase assembly protein I
MGKLGGVALDMKGEAMSERARDGGTAGDDGQARAALGLSTGWAVFSYLIAGMAAYGGIGWLIGRAVHAAILFPLGMLVGLGISLGYIIYRYGRAGSQTREGADR